MSIQEQLNDFIRISQDSFSPLAIDLIFASILILGITIGLIIGSKRGLWFFISGIIIGAVAWGTNQVVAILVYDGLVKNNYPELHSLIEISKGLDLGYYEILLNLIGLIYFLIITFLSQILTIALYPLLRKFLKETKIWKKEAGMKNFANRILGGFMGLIATFLLGIGIFSNASGTIRTVYEGSASKFNLFYCSFVESCKDDSSNIKLQKIVDSTETSKDLSDTDSNYTRIQLFQTLFYNSTSIPSLKNWKLSDVQKSREFFKIAKSLVESEQTLTSIVVSLNTLKLDFLAIENENLTIQRLGTGITEIIASGNQSAPYINATDVANLDQGNDRNQKSELVLQSIGLMRDTLIKLANEGSKDLEGNRITSKSVERFDEYSRQIEVVLSSN